MSRCEPRGEGLCFGYALYAVGDLFEVVDALNGL